MPQNCVLIIGGSDMIPTEVTDGATFGSDLAERGIDAFSVTRVTLESLTFDDDAIIDRYGEGERPANAGSPECSWHPTDHGIDEMFKALGIEPENIVAIILTPTELAELERLQQDGNHYGLSGWLSLASLAEKYSYNGTTLDRCAA